MAPIKINKLFPSSIKSRKALGPTWPTVQ